MSDLTAFIATPPASTAGVPIGYDGWRFVVEMGPMPTEHGSIVGLAVVGSMNVAEDSWVDITDKVHGVDITQGYATLADVHPDPGVMNLSLKSAGHEFAPWLDTLDSFMGAGARFQPGLLVRAGLVKSGDWWPVFTGEVEQWSEVSTGNDAVIGANLTVVETSARLARYSIEMDGTAVYWFSTEDPEGALLDEWITKLLYNFLYPSDWPYGYATPAIDSTYLSLQGETRSGSVLTMLQLVTESAMRSFRVDGTGRAVFTTIPTSTHYDHSAEAPPALTLTDDEVHADALQPGLDTLDVTNGVRYTSRNPGDFDNYLMADDEASRDRIGPKEIDLSHMLTYLYTVVGVWARDIVNTRSRPDKLPIVPLDQRHLNKIVGTEIDAPVTITWTPRHSPADLTATGYVRKIRHTINPALSPIKWTATYEIDTQSLEATS